TGDGGGGATTFQGRGYVYSGATGEKLRMIDGERGPARSTWSRAGTARRCAPSPARSQAPSSASTSSFWATSTATACRTCSSPAARWPTSCSERTVCPARRSLRWGDSMLRPLLVLLVAIAAALGLGGARAWACPASVPVFEAGREVTEVCPDEAA